MEPRAMLRKRFRAKASDHSEHDHWIGGKPYHKGAVCPSCKIPLLLLWDINCRDPRFPRRKFGELKRLPLYFCWSCVGDLYYQQMGDGAIRIHPGDRRDGPTSMYEGYPEFFERRGLDLIEGVPKRIKLLARKLTSIWDSAGHDEGIGRLNKAEEAEMFEFFGHRVPLPMCLYHHQFGGKPIHHSWAQEVFLCPNPACSGGRLDRLLRRKRPMKFLAGILNDPWAGLPLIEPANEETKRNVNFSISVQFHACDRCWTILGCNRCD